MNLSFTRGDDPEKVRENFRRMGMAIGFETKDLVLSDQTHTTNVRLVTEADRGKGFDRERDYTDVDGLSPFMQTVCRCISWIRFIKPLAFLIPAGRERFTA